VCAVFTMMLSSGISAGLVKQCHCHKSFIKLAQLEEYDGIDFSKTFNIMTFSIAIMIFSMTIIKYDSIMEEYYAEFHLILSVIYIDRH
jgi:hypothetical protein